MSSRDGSICEIEGEPTLEVNAGELLLLPRGDAHVLSDAPGQTPVVGRDITLPPGTNGLARIHYGGGGDIHPHHLRLSRQ